MQVAIPSYKRPQTLQRKTLALLRREGFDAKDITVFLASEEERQAYEPFLIADFSPALVVGRPGIHQQRAFIESYYSPGTRVLCLDDDVTAIRRLAIYTKPLPTLFQECFTIAAREGCYIWGIYPSSHGLCLKDRAIKGLTYIIGACFGMTISTPFEYPRPFSEDYRRSVLAYQRDGATLRFEGLGPVTRYFTEPGGLQEFRTPESQEAQMIEFREEFPLLSSLRRKPGKLPDLVLKRVVKQQIISPFSAPKEDESHQASSGAI